MQLNIYCSFVQRLKLLINLTIDTILINNKYNAFKCHQYTIIKKCGLHFNKSNQSTVGTNFLSVRTIYIIPGVQRGRLVSCHARSLLSMTLQKMMTNCMVALTRNTIIKKLNYMHLFSSTCTFISKNFLHYLFVQ